ncbi:ABC transporter ATP-binding protein [Desulfococcus sp.]|uniref:ABC transporter ATP-binding protein n=1 Tax=Desulfococcus sp. TaxID=2025834 RepID=UPI0035930DDC
MLHDRGYAQETALGAPVDSALLRELYPHVRPHRRSIFLAAFLALLMTLISLGMPYITKIAVDRHIVPAPRPQSHAERDGAPSAGLERRLSVDISSPETAAIVRRYPERFGVQGTSAEILLSETAHLSDGEIHILRQQDITGVGLAAVAFLILTVIEFVLNFFQMIVMEMAGQNIMHDLRMRLFRHIQGLPLSFFNRTPVARLVTRATNDIQNMHEFFTSIIVFVFRDVFLLVGITGVMIGIHWQLSLICFAILPFVFMASAFFSRTARGVFRTLRIKTAEINTRFSETIAGISVIQTFGEEENNARTFRVLNQEFYRAGMQQIHIFAVFMPLIEFFSAVSLALVIYYGGKGVLREDISLGILVAFISYMRMFFRPIRDLAEKYNILQNALSSAERILLLLNTRETRDQPHAPARSHPPAAIESLSFDNVSMSYVENEPVLRNVSFRMERNETTAIVGPTGSGKTTLIHLILGLYDPTSGCIRVNGEDIRHWSPGALRARMAVVPQDPFLFSESIRDNIRLGNPDISPEDLDRAIEASNLAPLIRRLPAGLDTKFSEGGLSISSGERQLVAIARALARNPDLILLDEATSHIDSETELKIQGALSNLMRDRTALIVAHRLSTARHADRIIVMESGRIIESGTHDELMALEKVYCKLNRLQHAHDPMAAPEP